MREFKKSNIILIIILLLYTILSFYKLGRNENPQTFVNLKNEEELIYKINADVILDSLMFYNANDLSYISIFLGKDEKKDNNIDENSNNAEAENVPNNEDEVQDSNIEGEGNNTSDDSFIYDSSYNATFPFQWNQIPINKNKEKYSYIVIQSYWDSTALGELKIYDINGNEVPLIPIGEKERILLDEQSTVPKEYSYMNSSYFDEIYFPRTAYEQLNNLPIYEYTHPPLGKLIMSIPMKFLGVTPFSYRLMGNIAGILMIFVMYCIAKELFKDEKYGLFAALIMALDGMHFVQTRIGTVDSFLVLFCLTSFLFFIKYIKMPKENTLKKKIIPLLISGTFWGMAISVKWTAAFVGLGMGVIYFVDLFFNKKFDIKLILLSVLAFVVIPLTIYVASYIPVIKNPNSGITGIKSFIDYQKRMYDYHSKLEATHPFTSKWYTWPILQKPMWFYVATFSDGTYGTISCMGNPMIWWLAVATSIFTLIYSIIKLDKEGLILITMIAATWLTYTVIGRVMFIYHYFITLPFAMLTIVFVLHKLIEWKKIFKYAIPILTVIFLISFIYFYPIYSGKPVSKEYVEKTKWFDTWIY